MPRRSPLLSAVETLHPAYFALVMATGALSIALDLLGWLRLSQALFALNAVAYGTLWVLLLVRLVRFPGRVIADFGDYARAPGFFTLVAATCVLGTNIVMTTGLDAVGGGLWIAGIVLGIIVMYGFFTAVVTHADKPTLADGINGAWLIASVAAQSIAVLGATLAQDFSAPQVPLFFSLILYLIGAMLYLSIITLIFYRFTFIRLTSATFTPPYWINMGAAAITALAGTTLIPRAALSPLLHDIEPFLEGFTLFFWATATWWIPLLLILEVWRHGIRRYPFRYEPQYWSMVFPLAMYTTATLRLAGELRLDFLLIMPRASIWLAALAWLIVFGGMVQRIVRQLTVQA